MEKRNLFLPILLIVLSIASLTISGLIIVKAFSKQSLPVSPPTPANTLSPPPDPTVNWKTYTDSKYSFSFKYPRDWVVTETDDRVVLLKDPDVRTVIGACPGYSFSVSTYDPYLNYSRFDKVVKSKLGGESIEAWTNNDSSCKEQFIFVNSLPTGTIKPKYIISFMSKNSNGNMILNQILSTFTFIDEPKKCSPIVDPCNPQGCDYDQSTCQNQLIEQCTINLEYVSSSVKPISCECPEGYTFKIVSTSWGPCPKPGMRDCPQTTVKCEKNSTSLFTCPTTEWVDCMPGPDPKPECSTEAMTWYKTNCPNFKGAAL